MLQLHDEQHQQHKQQEEQIQKEQREQQTQQTQQEQQEKDWTTTTAKGEHNRSCLCVPWGGGIASPPCPPPAVFLLLRAFVFARLGFFALV